MTEWWKEGREQRSFGTVALPTFAQAAQGSGPRQARSVKVGVLLDGDADYFTRAYTSKGRSGGSCAAMELKNRVERFIRKEKHVPTDVPIEIDALSFLNMKGLSKFLGDDMAAFAQGFNTSPYAFSMSDVGDIPQGADTALKSHLPSLLARSDFVLFGGSHDNGYSEILGGLPRGPVRDKLILLRTTPYCAKSILMLGLEEAHFHLLFEGRDPTERSRGNGHVAPPTRPLATTAPLQPAIAHAPQVKNYPAQSKSLYDSFGLQDYRETPEQSRYELGRNLMSCPAPRPFNKICGVLRTIPGGSAAFSVVSSRLSQQKDDFWGDGKTAFARFVQGAIDAGVVTTFHDDEDADDRSELTIKLTTRYRCTSIYVPCKFRPLVAEIEEHDDFEPLCSLIANSLMRYEPPPFPKNKGWGPYLAEAVKLGLVHTGTKGPGREWVELREGLLL